MSTWLNRITLCADQIWCFTKSGNCLLNPCDTCIHDLHTNSFQLIQEQEPSTNQRIANEPAAIKLATNVPATNEPATNEPATNDQSNESCIGIPTYIFIIQ